MSKNFNIAIAGLGNIGEYFFFKTAISKKRYFKKKQTQNIR